MLSMSATTLSPSRLSISSSASDAPVPSGSNQILRLNDARPVTNRASDGSSHIKSTGNPGPLSTRIVNGPSPTT
jgi:hypothetical protein